MSVSRFDRLSVWRIDFISNIWLGPWPRHWSNLFQAHERISPKGLCQAQIYSRSAVHLDLGPLCQPLHCQLSILQDTHGGRARLEFRRHGLRHVLSIFSNPKHAGQDLW